MVLTDRQRKDLHGGIYEYLCSRPGEAFQQAAAAMKAADPDSCCTDNNNTTNGNTSAKTTKTPLLEKKWTAIPRLQKKVLELERVAAQNAKIHAHRTGTMINGDSNATQQRRMLPRLPCAHTLQGHSMGVTSVVVHPVFTVVASGSEDGTIKIWDHENGDYIRTLKGHTNTVTAVAFSPSGTHLVSSSTDLSIKLWDFVAGEKQYQCLRTLRGHDHTISSVIFLPHTQQQSTSTGTAQTTTTGVDSTKAGATHLLSASRDQTVKMWDVETGFCDQTYTRHTDWVRCLAVREQSDGATLWASAGNDTTIQVYDASTSSSTSHTHVTELRGHEHVVETIAFLTEESKAAGQQQQRSASTSTSNSKHLATCRDYLASGGRDRTVRLWKISEATCLAKFVAHENWVRSVTIHPSGLYLISAGDDKSIRVFDIKANRCLRTLEKAHDHFVTSISIHHTLPIMVSGSVDQTIKCWQLD